MDDSVLKLGFGTLKRWDVGERWLLCCCRCCYEREKVLCVESHHYQLI